MKTLKFFWFLLLPFALEGQNWQNICSPGTTYFIDSNDTLQAFRLDSTAISANSDTTYYSYPAIRENNAGSGCHDIHHGSVLGFKVILTHDGSYCLFNRNNDTVRIRTTAQTGQTWRFCDLAGGGYVMASIGNAVSEDVLGQPDSVKSISFQAKNAEGKNISHPLNDTPVKLSKHYGLVTSFDVYHLPDTIRLYELAGKSTPPIGIQNYGEQEVYDFAIGDEFHYQIFSNALQIRYYEKAILTVLDRIDYINNYYVDYLMKRCTRRDYVYPPGFLSEIDTTTIRHYFYPNDPEEIISMPNEYKPHSYGYSPAAAKFSQARGAFNDRFVKFIRPGQYIFDSVSNCYYEEWEPGYITKSEYVPGLGRTYYYEYMSYGYQSFEKDLVYFSKGSETWGTPVSTNCNTLVAMPESPNTEIPGITISPNPVTDHAEIKVTGLKPGENAEIVLLDYLGKEVFRNRMDSNPYLLSVSGIPKGLYIIKVIGKSNTLNGPTKILIN